MDLELGREMGLALDLELGAQMDLAVARCKTWVKVRDPA